MLSDKAVEELLKTVWRSIESKRHKAGLTPEELRARAFPGEAEGQTEGVGPQTEGEPPPF